MSRWLVLLMLAGCADQPGALVRFGRLANPVLLGPVDRVGGGAPLPSQQVERFDYTGVHGTSSYSTEDAFVRTTYTTGIQSEDLGGQGRPLSLGDAALDVRLSDLHPSNWANLAAAVQKVFITGAIVKVQP